VQLFLFINCKGEGLRLILAFDDRRYTEDSIIKQLSLIELHGKDGSAVEAGCGCIEGKHLVMLEGLAEEGIGFSKTEKERMFYTKLSSLARNLRKSIEQAEFTFPKSSVNPGRRRFLPSGLTSCERKHPNVQRKLSRCIKKLEPEERAGRIESAVAVCRKSIRCPQ